MNRRTAFRVLVTLLLLVFVASTLDAQRGRGRGSRGKGGKSSQRKGGGGKKGSGFLLPRPASPVGANPLADFPLPGARVPVLSGSALLPRALEPEELPDIPAFEGSTFEWRDPRDPELERFYFDVCDHDANEWISFREARVSLEISRDSFFVYDSDRDGRIDMKEFSARYSHVVERHGSFPAPQATTGEATEDVEGAEEAAETEDGARIMQRFDGDLDLLLSPEEIDAIITKLRLPASQVNVERVLDYADLDDSGFLGPEEMPMLHQGLKWAMDHFGVSPAALLEDIPQEALTARSVRRIRTPTTHFMRLDQNGDGVISTEDLTVLQSPMHLPVRASAMVAAMDTNGDGALSAEEFRAAFQ